MRKCYLGSRNAVKLEATREVLPDFEVIGIDAQSGVRKQPLDDTETIQGAMNRARSLPKDGLRIGLEAGVQFHGEILFLINWGVLIDEQDNLFYAGGTRIPLPEFVKEKLLQENMELADVMDEYMKQKDIRSHEGAVGVFTDSLVQRKDIFTHIVKLLYGQYLRKEKS